jgi:dephospho-CoA kinase
MNIIMFAGKARAGKTTAAEAIARKVYESGMIPVLESFAAPLKEKAEAKGYSKKDNPKKYREYCQKEGSLKRKKSSDYWINAMEERINEHIALEQESIKEGHKFWERVIIIDDCRYLNEVGWGRKVDSVCIFISGNQDNKKASWRNHESEQMATLVEGGNKEYLEMFDDVIKNDKDKKTFIERIEKFFDEWTTGNSTCNCSACKKNKYTKLWESMDMVMDLFSLIEGGEIEMKGDTNEPDYEEDSDNMYS